MTTNSGRSSYFLLSDAGLIRQLVADDGNVLAYIRVVDGISTVATYSYDDANQLLTASAAATATEGETTWYYTYRCNGKSMGKAGTKPAHPKPTRASAA